MKLSLSVLSLVTACHTSPSYAGNLTDPVMRPTLVPHVQTTFDCGGEVTETQRIIFCRDNPEPPKIYRCKFGENEGSKKQSKRFKLRKPNGKVKFFSTKTEMDKAVMKFCKEKSNG